MLWQDADKGDHLKLLFIDEDEEVFDSGNFDGGRSLTYIDSLDNLDSDTLVTTQI